MKSSRLLCALLTVLVLLSGCEKEPPPPEAPAEEESHIATLLAMDTVMKLTVYGPNGQSAADRASERIQELEEQLKTAKVVDTSTLDPDVVHVGSTVRFFYSAYNAERTFHIVGSAEGSGSDTEIKNVTNDSPIGKALLDHRVGDEVDVHTPKGVFQAKILEVHLH